MPRLLCCTDTYLPQVNGVSIVTALSVAGLMERGWECMVIAPRYPGDESARTACTENIVAIPSVPMPRYPEIRLAFPNPWRVRRIMKDFRPDLVHCATEFAVGAVGAREARRAGVPVVTSYHTDFARYTESYGVPWLRGPVMRYISRFHQRAARTYTPGSPARDELIERGVRNVEVWGRGVDINAFHPSKRDGELRNRLGVANRFLFLHVSRLAPEKGTALILDAYRLASSQLPPDSTRLVIAGEGPELAALQLRAPLGTSFLGFLDRATELPALYASADAFCFASTTETLGLVVLEAMSCGVPVIAAPAGGVADHLRDGVNGIAFPANDAAALASAMIALAADRSQRDVLARGARATAEGLGWEEELDRLDWSYREVLAVERERTAASAGGISPVSAHRPRLI